jgi:PTS system nitrogen regulatory IIA component
MMNVIDLLSPTDVIFEQRPLNKTQLLKELCRRAASSLQLKPGQVADAILKREKLGSTGIGGGVALPHASFRELTQPFGVLVRLSTPIDFEAVDGGRVDVVFLLLAPTDPEGNQLNALACVARTLRDQGVLSSVRQATDIAAAYRAVIGASDGPASGAALSTLPTPSYGVDKAGA